MIEMLIFSTQTQDNVNLNPNVVVLSDEFLKDLNLSDNTKMAITKYADGRIELRPIVAYAKGDIRRLKGLVKTPIRATIDEMNEGIAMGAVYGE